MTVFRMALVLVSLMMVANPAWGQETPPGGEDNPPPPLQTAPYLPPSMQTSPPAQQPQPPAEQAPRAEQPPARVINAMSTTQPAPAQAVPAVAPAAPGGGGGLDLGHRIGTGVFIGTGYDAGVVTGAAFRAWPHRMIGLQADVGFSAWAREVGGEMTGVREIIPRLRAMIPVVRSQWSHFYLGANGGPIIVKPAGGDQGLGFTAGVDLGYEVFLVRELHLSLDVTGGVALYSYRARDMGTGARSQFAFGVNYYF